MKLLLLGKNGQVGFELQRALAPLGEVVAYGRNECDLADGAGLSQCIDKVAPDVIVNAAAYTAVDKAESDSELAYAINSIAPKIIAQKAAELGALLVHYSTDYVFDGDKKVAYVETDSTNPQNIYGASKLAGEQQLQSSTANYLIFRTCWVVGAQGNNFAKTMLRLASEHDSLKVVSDQIGVPTSAALIADVTGHVIRQVVSERKHYGIYHLAAAGQTNWHEYACHVIETARKAGKPITVKPEAIRPITTSEYPTPAKRPSNSLLNTEKLCSTFNLHMPDWRFGVDHILEQIL